MAHIAIVFAGLIRRPVDVLFHNIPFAARATYFFLLPIILYDLWSIRKIHRATLWSGALLIVVFELRFHYCRNKGLARFRRMDPSPDFLVMYTQSH